MKQLILDFQNPATLDDLINAGIVGRHETYPPRYGWLKKGYDAVDKGRNDFIARDAIVRLGVGKNMVNSIRYWGQAFKLLEANGREINQAEFGNKLLDTDNGWDPYLEDPASLWLLHWQLFIPPLNAVSWALAFNKCNLPEFDVHSLSSIIIDAAQKHERLANVSKNTFLRDAACIINMYNQTPNDTEEWGVISPFVKLDLIRPSSEKHVTFNREEKIDLPDLLFAATCFSYASHYLPITQKTISINKLTYGFNSPGAVFKFTESTVGAMLYKAVNVLKDVELQESGPHGPQLYFNRPSNQIYWEILDMYYDQEV